MPSIGEINNQLLNKKEVIKTFKTGNVLCYGRIMCSEIKKTTYWDGYRTYMVNRKMFYVLHALKRVEKGGGINLFMSKMNTNGVTASDFIN